MPLSREFSCFISPHETRIFNITRWYTGDGRAAGHAVDFMADLFHTWQAAGGRMTGEEVYRALWGYLREVPSKCEAWSSTDIARSLSEPPPEERMLILLKGLGAGLRVCRQHHAD